MLFCEDLLEQTRRNRKRYFAKPVDDLMSRRRNYKYKLPLLEVLRTSPRVKYRELSSLALELNAGHARPANTLRL